MTKQVTSLPGANVIPEGCANDVLVELLNEKRGNDNKECSKQKR